MPCVEGHHPENKEISLGDMLDLPLKKILDLIRVEKIEVVCGSCHRLETATVFRQFSDFICNPTLFFDDSGNYECPEIIYKKIDLLLIGEMGTKRKVKDIKYYIKCWLRKRSFIEQVYDGKCVGCGIVHSIASYLYHHINNLLKEGDTFFFLLPSITAISKEAKKQKVVCLCDYCHKLITATNFIPHIDEIFPEEEYSYKVSKLKVLFHRIQNNIDNFILETDNFKNIHIKDHLQSSFGFRNSKEKYLIHINELSKNSLDGWVISSSLAKSMNITREATNKYLYKILSETDLLDVIKEGSPKPNKYRLSELGQSILNSNLEEVNKYWAILDKIKKLKKQFYAKKGWVKIQ